MKTTESVKVCTATDLFNIEGEDAGDTIKILDEYLSIFAAPEKDGKCLHCDTVLDGMLGSFTWGLCSGEGKCSNCGWPARAHHNPENNEGPLFERHLEVILQYHPDNVTMDTERETNE